MKKISVIIIFLLISKATVLTGQITKSPNLEVAKLNHKNMAILPVFVTEKDKTAKARKENKDGNVTNDENEGFGLQRSLYDYFFTKKPKKINWTVEFQEYEITNKILKDNNIQWLDIPDYDKGELAKLLGVDAVMYVDVIKTENLTKGSQAAVSFFTGVTVPTGNVIVTTSVFDGASAENLWKYERKIPTDYWTSSGPDKLVDNLFKKIVQQFPWSQKVVKK